MYSGSVDVVRLLFQFNADPNARTRTTRRTPLHTAARNGHLDVVKLLIRHGTKTCVLMDSEKGGRQRERDMDEQTDKHTHRYTHR